MIHQPWLALVGTDPIQCIPSYTNTNTVGGGRRMRIRGKTRRRGSRPRLEASGDGFQVLEEIKGFSDMTMSLDETPVSGSCGEGGTYEEPRKRSTVPSL
ncbi:hypothetical protein Ahy_A09g042322 isoform B [Arachis hypogaea]|uniref:Uncharacterized protein n=1 Tax=Arachis hypogaea TaxID=3818 RepID=A0A445BFG6_ARAHY|nr:hypothetical protein Ahy_A09g042322 isoform B [Arachis hypogaea]